MALYGCFYSKVILKIGQTKGAQDPGCGDTLELFGLIKGGD